jgi:hypothetical protein
MRRFDGYYSTIYIPMRERITIEDAQPLIGLPIRTVQAMAAKGEIPGAAKMRRRWTA